MARGCVSEGETRRKGEWERGRRGEGETGFTVCFVAKLIELQKNSNLSHSPLLRVSPSPHLLFPSHLFNGSVAELGCDAAYAVFVQEVSE